MSKYTLFINGFNERKLMNKINICYLPENLRFIGLELNGQMYLKLNRKDIEICFNENIDILKYWGFTEPIPINGKIVVECVNNDDNIKYYITNINNEIYYTKQNGSKLTKNDMLLFNDYIDENILNIEYIYDDFSLWKLAMNSDEGYEICFHDNNLNKKNYIRIKRGLYGILHSP